MTRSVLALLEPNIDGNCEDLEFAMYIVATAAALESVSFRQRCKNLVISICIAIIFRYLKIITICLNEMYFQINYINIID